MPSKTKKLETELEEQNDFLKHMLRSLDDLKKGRVKKFDFSQ
ncbi:MAG: hypothetical protein QF362_05125 [Candidatus Woesearchaeota archaeon]|jgi:hypothetical protein|nr:hypothetical protein [Candidatus Woesearchaeota archaeon]|tara:strand:- start:235 stop:360 length:126 start_codon:yes stop_codon:yes gene_type:complete